MRTTVTLVLATCLCWGTTVLAAQPGTRPAAPAAQPPAPPPPPAKPPLAVPDGPALATLQLEGGLVAEDLKIGDGYEVKPGGYVLAHYHGTLKADPSKVFDSSFQRGEPVAFPLSGVIEGWQKGVPGMKIGGVRRLIIPSKMAYGERGSPPKVPGNADLVFVIQLVDALQIEDLRPGAGPAATGNFVAVTVHTITDAEGKEIERSTPDNPYVWIPGEFQALQFGLDGMKVGGKRRLVVPREMNGGPNPNAPPNRPIGVSLTLELELVALRNLPGRPR